ncbi:MAG: UDP-glucose 4-epimerase, partial [uncultured Rubrobacteraceae bacterium]
ELAHHRRLRVYRDRPDPILEGRGRARHPRRGQPHRRRPRRPRDRHGLCREGTGGPRPDKPGRAGRARRGRHPGRGARAAGGRRRGRHRPPRRQHGGAALRRGPAGRLQEERLRDAQLPGGRQAQRRGALRLRLERGDGDRGGRTAHPRGDGPPPGGTLRCQQARRRGLLLRLLPDLRHRDRGLAFRQRLRPPLRPQEQRRRALYQAGDERGGPGDLRRRHPDPRLHLHRGPHKGHKALGHHARRRRRDVPDRHQRRDHRARDSGQAPPGPRRSRRQGRRGPQHRRPPGRGPTQLRRHLQGEAPARLAGRDGPRRGPAAHRGVVYAQREL